ncbi:MAG: SCO family protein [Proteobacteria bacterium]|nr:SCO family protein [Pseudomonadota bacterium]
MAKAGKGKTRRSQKTAVPEPAPIKPFLKGRLGQIAVLSVVGFLAMIGYWISQSPMDKPPAPPAAAIGGPFTLVDHQGRPVTEDYFKGRLMLVYFGYTFCPDVCPTALTDMGDALGILGAAADKVTPVFITVDPDRDTPEHMKEYLKFFHPRMIGLTGTPEQTAAALKAYKVFSAKAPVEGGDAGDYLMDHTSIIYLMGPDGAYKTHFSHGAGAEDMAKGIRKFL